jgi:cardiolipin synthase
MPGSPAHHETAIAGRRLSPPDSDRTRGSNLSGVCMDSAFGISDLERIFQRKFSVATAVKLLWKRRDSFEVIFNAVNEAQRLICLQFYIFKNDETGRELSNLLRKKGQEGVKIYLLYDHFGSIGTPGRFWKEMKAAGIKIRASHPFKWTAPFRYVHRDHRKLIVIDLKKAFTGGLNIANEYSGFHLRRQRRGWRDTGVMLEGPIVEELFDTFSRSWYTWRGETIYLKGDDETSVEKRKEEGVANRPPGFGKAEGLPALPIFVYSLKGRRRMRNLFRYSIDHARKSVFLTTAYFTPSRRMIASLEKAVTRGVDVRLLVPGRSDIPAASYAGRAFFTRLLKAGVQIYTYLGEMLHAKTYLFDGHWSIIGSTNLDYQSLMYNDEGNVGIFDDSFALRMAEIFEEDTKNAVRIELEAWRQRSLLDKMKEHIFALFRKRL